MTEIRTGDPQSEPSFTSAVANLSEFAKNSRVAHIQNLNDLVTNVSGVYDDLELVIEGIVGSTTSTLTAPSFELDGANITLKGVLRHSDRINGLWNSEIDSFYNKMNIPRDPNAGMSIRVGVSKGDSIEMEFSVVDDRLAHLATEYLARIEFPREFIENRERVNEGPRANTFSARKTIYLPEQNPSNKLIQQNYSKILRKGVDTILEVARTQ